VVQNCGQVSCWFMIIEVVLHEFKCGSIYFKVIFDGLNGFNIFEGFKP
jgi:hypothetical protein